MRSFALDRNFFDCGDCRQRRRRLQYAPLSAKLSDYDYTLPDDLIADRPLPQRDASRMMVLHRDTQSIEHRQFRDLQSYVQPGDLFVLNDTRVLAARKFSDDGRIEFLFIERLGQNRWKCLVKPGRKMRLGATFQIDHVTGRVEEILPEGERVIVLEKDVDVYAGGIMPLPPYIGRSSDVEDEARYQTVFAREPGAIAAPTAGLHFTPEILREIPHALVTLHVGPGTFQPVHSENIAEHQMHSEQFSISSDTAEKVNTARRVLAVGTTSVRVLESVAHQTRPVKPVEFKKKSQRKPARRIFLSIRRLSSASWTRCLPTFICPARRCSCW